MEKLKSIELAGKLCQAIWYGSLVLQGPNETAAANGDVRQAAGDLQRDAGEFVAEILDSESFALNARDLAKGCVAATETLLQQLELDELGSDAKRSDANGGIHKADVLNDILASEPEDFTNLIKTFASCKNQLEAYLSTAIASCADKALDSIIESGRATPEELAALRSACGGMRLETMSVGDEHSSIFNFAERLCKAVSRLRQVAILDLLKFQSVHERFESISQAQERTFNWLLGSDGVSEGESAKAAASDQEAILRRARERLTKWLKDGDGFFYLSGKPGAGKSTLVKFICLHDNFYRFAQAWAGTSTLLVGRFFFWKPGKSEQKSISGLLRGLLYSILEKTPSIAPIAFPELSDDLLQQRGMSAAIEHKDVERAFDNILQGTKCNGHKIILTIDGLDEFEGDHAELLKLMKSWVSKYPSTIKICVSSREYGIFEDFFASSPKFRLHELTRSDMSHLITSRFKPNRFFTSLPEEDKQSIKALMCERAEGVFLWVVMVVAAMDDGLLSRSITNASELKRSIQDCPTELDDLLPHLLRSVSVHNRVWAFKAISLVKYAQFRVPELLRSAGSPPGVGLLDLMLLDEASPNWSLAAFQPRSESKSADISTRLEAARKKILGRCKGFLSVITISEARSWPANGDERLYAAVTHRSVVEFLDSDMAEGFMAQYLTNFHPFYASFSTMLACLRFLEPSNYPLLKPAVNLPKREILSLADVLADSLQDTWRETINCAHQTGQSGSPRFISLLDSVGDAVKRHLTIQLTMQRIRLASDAASPHQLLSVMALGSRVFEYSEWRRSQAIMDRSTYPMSYEFLMSFHNVVQYFRLDDYEFPAPDQRRDGNTLVNKPVDWIKWDLPIASSAMPAQRLSSLLTEFLERGLDVNWTLPVEDHQHWGGSQTVEGTPWTCWQMFLWAMLMGEVPFVEKYAELVDCFLRRGADVKLSIFSTVPPRNLHMERLTPQDGWILLVPYVQCSEIINNILRDAITHSHETRRRLEKVPAVLIQESAPLFKAAKAKDWHFTVRDLLETWFQNDGGYFAQLCGALDDPTKASLPPRPSHCIETDAELLGTPHGVADLGIIVDEMRVEAGVMDASATIRRHVRVV